MRINLKVKKYSRAARRITGSHYKRQQWRKRQKEDEGEGGEGSGLAGKRRKSSYNKYTCFKCGKAGHWASKSSQKDGGKEPDNGDSEIVAVDDDSAMKCSSEPLGRETIPTGMYMCMCLVLSNVHL